MTLWAQGEAVGDHDILPLSWRIANALVSYVAYLGQFFYPVGLAVFYPHPETDLPVWKVVGALAGVGVHLGGGAGCGGGIRICSWAGCGTWGCWCR